MSGRARGRLRLGRDDPELVAQLTRQCGGRVEFVGIFGQMSIDVDGDLVLPSVRHGFEALNQMYGTAEFHEGTAAFIERRPPRFRRGITPE